MNKFNNIYHNLTKLHFKLVKIDFLLELKLYQFLIDELHDFLTIIFDDLSSNIGFDFLEINNMYLKRRNYNKI